jgi:hypothetical protein
MDLLLARCRHGAGRLRIIHVDALVGIGVIPHPNPQLRHRRETGHSIADRCGQFEMSSPGPLKQVPEVTCNMAPMAAPDGVPGVNRRVREHRRRLRALGLRPVQIWVPDVRSPEFAQEAHRQSEVVAASERAADDQAFIDALSSDGE